MAATSLLLVLSVILLLWPFTEAENNVLLTGQTLGTDSQLTYKDYTFVMQGDCNLVLYNQGPGFHSNTYGKGVNCTLSITDNGRLIVRRGDGSTVWIAPNFYSKKGNYAAVLRPDGQVAVYGRSVWSTPSTKAGEVLTLTKEFSSSVKNLIFSGEVLSDGAKLTSRDYAFVMKSDCNLALEKAGNGAIWQSATTGNGRSCFMRLDHRGQIAIKDDAYRGVWSSSPASDEGEYVLILQANGQAVVYGPLVWSTASGQISMVVTKE